MSAEIPGPVPRRAVVLVGGPAAPYSRAIRIARALAAEGYAVEIAAVAAPGLPEREAVAPAAAGSVGDPAPDPDRVGAIEVRRYRPSGVWAIAGASEAATGAASTGRTSMPGLSRPVRRVVRALALPLLVARRWLYWPHAVRGWWATLARQMAPADLYHACGSLTIAAALAAQERAPVGPSGTRSRVIYDVIDNVAESNEALSLPAPFRRRNARKEADWARAADAVVTVNNTLAELLEARWRLDRPPRFAVIGDFGVSTEAEAKVAALVRAEKPDFVITTGDNNYPNGSASTIDPNIGRFYHDFIHPYVGSYGAVQRTHRRCAPRRGVE